MDNKVDWRNSCPFVFVIGYAMSMYYTCMLFMISFDPHCINSFGVCSCDRISCFYIHCVVSYIIFVLAFVDL